MIRMATFTHHVRKRPISIHVCKRMLYNAIYSSIAMGTCPANMDQMGNSEVGPAVPWCLYYDALHHRLRGAQAGWVYLEATCDSDNHENNIE